MPFVRFTVTGVVQGVGFRPYVRNAGMAAGLRGYVQNIGSGVVIVTDDANKLRTILAEAPPHIRIDSVVTTETSETYEDFTIRESSGSGFAEIPPDFFLCDDCVVELFDDNNRRHGYFFLTCTNCGPRYTIALESPYDRVTTTMRDFPMCVKCREEYTDPKNRRYHAQTIACHDCGPKLTLFQNGKPSSGYTDDEKLNRVADALRNGEIVAMKGIGGFHLVCAATDENVTKLNRLTGRLGKPYALLCRDLTMARTFSDPTSKEAALLESPARPIVLVKKNAATPPGSELDTVGIMLSYSALHRLLFQYYEAPLICTSSNRADAPITTTGEEQSASLILDHDRVIENAADDSVIKVICDTPLFLRRSRGYVPQSLALPNPCTTPLLAIGAEMNNTFALYDGHGRVTLSPHLGNTADPDTFEHFQKTLERFLAYTHIVPEVILCDAHPEYRTALYGQELSKKLSLPLVPIQHHRAHAYGVAAEHGLTDFVAIVCDGLGYGDDGTIWGGEIFDGSERIGHFETHPQLGSDSATRYPHKMLYAILRSFFSSTEARRYMDTFSSPDVALLEKQYQERFNAPLTSSCGRILDAASALLGFCSERTYDGRPAMLLEANSTEPYELAPAIDGTILRTTPLFEYLVTHLDQDKKRLAATVEQYLAAGLYEIAAQKNKPIVWAGGCVYNRLMTEYFLKRGVLVNRAVPAGDGGISFGQIASYLANTRDDIARGH